MIFYKKKNIDLGGKTKRDVLLKLYNLLSVPNFRYCTRNLSIGVTANMSISFLLSVFVDTHSSFNHYSGVFYSTLQLVYGAIDLKLIFLFVLGDRFETLKSN